MAQYYTLVEIEDGYRSLEDFDMVFDNGKFDYEAHRSYIDLFSGDLDLSKYSKKDLNHPLLRFKRDNQLKRNFYSFHLSSIIVERKAHALFGLIQNINHVSMPILNYNNQHSDYTLVVFPRDISHLFDFHNSTFYRSFVPKNPYKINSSEVIQFDNIHEYHRKKSENIENGIIRPLKITFNNPIDFLSIPGGDIIISPLGWSNLKNVITNFSVSATNLFTSTV